MSRFRLVPVLVAASLILAGCATGHQVPGSSVSSSSATLEPTPTQVRETGLTPPARTLGGDCANLLTNAEASALLGVRDVSLFIWDFAPELTVALHGGMKCHWNPVDEVGSAGIDVVVLPAGTPSYQAQTGCHGPRDEEIAATCTVEALVNGTRISGRLWLSADSTGPASKATDDLLKLFTERAKAAVPVPVPIPAIGAWALPVDCAAVVAAGDFTKVPGLGASTTGKHVGDHPEAYPPAEQALWGGLGMPFCLAEGQVEVVFVAMGGGRWLENTVAAVGTPFTIEGYDAAYVTPGQGDLTKVDVFDGPNWLHFQIRHTSNAKALADALFAALNTTAAQ